MRVWDAPPLAGRGAGRAKPTFVGRAAELASAERSWAAVSSGVRELIFVGGEPGAGKSRFVEEIAAALHLSGAVVLVGTCSPEPRPPYEPFVECLEQLFGGTVEGALADCLPDSARELLRLTPLVRRHRADLQLPADDDRDYRRELFDALASLLRSVSQVRPVVCVLEDLHWAGTPTLQLLSYVTQRSARTRLLLLCTHRTTAPDRTDELTYAIADLYRLDGVRRIDLPSLSADEIAQYLVADGDLPARRAREYAAVLRDQTGGNPFFLRETWRDVINRGVVSRGPFAESAPVSIRETLQRRLSRLAPGDREVLETAAVLGDGGDLRTLIAAREGDAGAVLSALDAAARFGFVDAEELARGRVLFPHTLTRQAVLDLVSPSRRILLHARIGDVLQSAGLDSAQVVLQVANHFARARALGYGGKAAEYFVLSAREAERSLAFEDAAAWYAQAADLCAGSEGEREEMRFAAARSHVRAGDHASAMDLYRLLSAARDPRMRLRAAVGYEEAAARPGTPGADVCGLLTAALDAVPADEDDSDYLRAIASLGRAMALTGAADRARALGEHALGCARRLGDERLLLHALRTMMIHDREPESLGACLAMATEVARLARDCEDWDGLGESAMFRAAIAYLSADPIAWADALADMELAGRKTGQPLGRYLRGCNDYAQAFLRGDFTAAERIAKDLLEVGRSFGPDDTEGPYGLQMYMVRRETGALEALRPLVDVIGKEENAWEPGLLALYTELGMAGPAQRLLRRLIAGLDDAPARQSAWAQWTAVLVSLVEAALALRDAEAARRLRPMLVPLSGLQLMAGQFVAVFGPADAYLAALDSLLGDGESADQLFDRALAQSDKLGSVVHRAAILAAWSAHLRSRGDTSRRYEDMRDEAGRLVAKTGEVRLARLLEQDAVGHPAGLTAREIDVLRLIARGCSNRDIAHELKITENTAANHVRSLLIKTGAANRTQLAMMAVARHWVDDNAPEFAP